MTVALKETSTRNLISNTNDSRIAAQVVAVSAPVMKSSALETRREVMDSKESQINQDLPESQMLRKKKYNYFKGKGDFQ